MSKQRGFGASESAANVGIVPTGDFGADGSAKSLTRMADRRSRKVFLKKRKWCQLDDVDDSLVDYKNPELLFKFVSKGGRILSARTTGLCRRHQNMVRHQICIARHLALMPFVKTKTD